MKKIFFAVLVLSFLIIIACAPLLQRSNPYDSGSTNFSAGSNVSFASNFTATWSTTSNILLSWGAATSNEGYRVYYVSGSTTQPSSALATTTNVSLSILVTNNGVQRFWVEAFSGTNSSVTKSFVVNSTLSGWSIQSTAGVGDTPCLRLVNVPLGSSVSVSFTGTTSFACPINPVISNSVKSSGFAGSVAVTQIFGLTTGVSTGTNYMTNASYNFSTFTAVSSLSVPPFSTGIAVSSPVTYTITIANLGDSDGINFVLIDNIFVIDNAGPSTVYSQAFTSSTAITGNLE